MSEWKFAAILLAGVSFAVFNVVDPMIIHKRFRKPIIIVTRTRPDSKAVKRALQKYFLGWRICWKTFEKLGLAYKGITLAGKSPIYVETVNASFQ